jgi:hypothetical protein
MARDIKIRLKRLEDEAGILVMSRHSSEPAIGQGAVGQLSFGLNGETVADIFIGHNVVASPLTLVRIGGADTGDKLSVCWRPSRESSVQVATTVR